jgi:polysaccharide export outer membrane protein
VKGCGELFAEGLTVSELRDSVRNAYTPVLRDPEVSVILTGFEKPYFLAGGQVARPGKNDLRSPTGVVAAIAMAGGFNDQAKHSQVILFRQITDGVVESHVLNIKTMLATRNLEEDIELKPGDMLFVPQKPNIKNTALFPHLEPVIGLNSSIGFREMLWKKVLTNAQMYGCAKLRPEAPSNGFVSITCGTRWGRK